MGELLHLPKLGHRDDGGITALAEVGAPRRWGNYCTCRSSGTEKMGELLHLPKLGHREGGGITALAEVGAPRHKRTDGMKTLSPTLSTSSTEHGKVYAYKTG
jgi:hypothetical protein